MALFLTLITRNLSEYKVISGYHGHFYSEARVTSIGKSFCYAGNKGNQGEN